jgi:flagellar motor protein MotB
MADKKATIIIKKVKKGAHGAAHGGAWKVAFADFMTAMMCFFLVMWLMGADETTKAAISAYFNNPSSPEAWRPDLHDVDAIPLGNQTGAGDTVLKGADGTVPEDLIQRPSPVIERKPESEGPVEKKDMFSGEDLAAADAMSFVIPESQLFRDDSADLMVPEAMNSLKKIGKIARNFKGSLVVRGTYDDQNPSAYELTMSRLIAVKSYVVDQRWEAEDLVSVSQSKYNRGPASSATPVKAPHRFVFSFSRDGDQ